MRPTFVSVTTAGLAVLATGCASLAPPSASESAPPRAPEAAPRREATAAERIEFYSAAVTKHPRLYPAHTQLGVALLDRTRETHDPRLLAGARKAEETSLAIQPGYEAMFAMTAIQNFSHRFEDAIRWGKRAAAASIGGVDAPDPAVVAALVEAHLGFGQPDEAERLLPPSLEGAKDFHTAVSAGRVLAERGKPREAAIAMSRASELALQAREPALAAWAETAAAGVLLDNGYPDEAGPHLDAAAKLATPTPFLRLHQAELALATGHAKDALAIFEEFLRVDPDPSVEALAADAARRAGDEEAAERHFRTAEQGLRRAIDANEVYTLGALAKLYLQADRNLDEARRLARENLRWKRDRAATETMAAIESRLSQRRRTSPR